jgi:hypothetical protein
MGGRAMSVPNLVEFEAFDIDAHVSDVGQTAVLTLSTDKAPVAVGMRRDVLELSRIERGKS